MDHSNVTLLGRLIAQPELLVTKSGKHYSEFVVAINRRTTWAGKVHHRVSYIDCTAWERIAISASERTAKGSRVYVSGPIETSSYKRKDGSYHKKTWVTAVYFVALDEVEEAEGGENDKLDEEFGG